MQKGIRIIIYIAGVLFLATGVAKVVSATGHARILDNPDPIFRIPFRDVFYIVGTIELIVATVCFVSKSLALRAGLMAWLATGFVCYRIGLVAVGYRKPCSCLGSLTDVLHIPSQAADTMMKIVLAYLLMGGYAILFWLWWQKGNVSSMTISSQAPLPQE